MSLISKLSLLASFMGTGGIILYVHYSQTWERERLRAGVLKEFEARAENANRKAQNLHILNQQKELEKFLRKEQEAVQVDG